MTQGTSDSASDRPNTPRPTALKLAPTERYGSTKTWFAGVVLQQACQAMVRGAP